VIPLQDVVPSGRIPIATLSLIGINAILFGAQTFDMAVSTEVATPFMHVGKTAFAIGMACLWLFGDNVEARLGRISLVAIYLAAGWLAGQGAAGAITAVMGAYFMLLPHSRVLVLVPVPLSLVEVPAAYFLGVWLVLHLLSFMMRPSGLWEFAVAFAIGAAVARLKRKPIAW
jgi:membrane associated rhomboid family serine protease